MSACKYFIPFKKIFQDENEREDRGICTLNPVFEEGEVRFKVVGEEDCKVCREKDDELKNIYNTIAGDIEKTAPEAFTFGTTLVFDVFEFHDINDGLFATLDEDGTVGLVVLVDGDTEVKTRIPKEGELYERVLKHMRKVVRKFIRKEPGRMLDVYVL